MRTFKKFVLCGLLMPAGSCGVDVGNPTKPVLTEVPEEGVKDELALSSVEQLEEAFLASSNDTSSLSGEAVVYRDRKCTAVDAFQVKTQTNISETKSTSAEGDEGNRVIVNTEKNFENTLTSEDEGLLCGPLGLFPRFNWDTLSAYQSAKTMTRHTERTVVDLATAKVEERVVIDVSGARDVRVEKVSKVADLVNLTKSIRFDSILKRTKEADSGVVETSTSMVTLKNLLIEEAEIETGSKNRTIKEGSVSSSYSNGELMILDYANLLFEGDGSCRPVSGSIQATIFHNGDRNTPVYEYTIDFLDGEATMTFSDSSKRVLQFVECGKK